MLLDLNDLPMVELEFVLDVLDELDSSMKHGEFNSVHEAYAVILEEVDEFWDEVKEKIHSPDKMRAELIQVAAMCLKTIKFLEKQ